LLAIISKVVGLYYQQCHWYLLEYVLQLVAINNIRSKTNKHLRSCLTADAAIDIKILLKNEDSKCPKFGYWITHKNYFSLQKLLLQCRIFVLVFFFKFGQSWANCLP
jgi:uncharacterized paraquat-inducible protein A